MIHTVVWRPSAVAQLAQLWVESANRAELTVAVDNVERLLRDDPHGQGESRAARTRIVILRPIVIRYSISESDRLVEVITVHEIAASRNR
jgi:hypothetical protein